MACDSLGSPCPLWAWICLPLFLFLALCLVFFLGLPDFGWHFWGLAPRMLRWGFGGLLPPFLLKKIKIKWNYLWLGLFSKNPLIRQGTAMWYAYKCGQKTMFTTKPCQQGTITNIYPLLILSIINFVHLEVHLKTTYCMEDLY